MARNLAAAAAAAGNRVILVEADLRKPTVASAMGIDTKDAEGKPLPGLAQVLGTSLTYEKALTKVDVASGHDGAGGANLDVLLAGPSPPNAADLIESSRMRRLLGALGERYDLVVVDTPPLLAVSDAVPLLKQVSGIIVVTRLGRTERAAAAALRHQLENLEAPTLGVVVNGVTPSAQGYAYGYGYGYG